MGTIQCALGNSLLAIAMALPGLARAAGEQEPHEDPAKLRGLIASHISDLEGAEVTGSGGGLKVKAFLVPDALAYRIAKEYLDRREAGEGHEDAVRWVSGLLPTWKRREGQAAVKLKIENSYPRTGSAGDPMARKKIFTLQKDFTQEGAVLFSGAGKQIPARLAETPLNLRVAQLRKKKFWTTEDGATQRGPSDPSDPASVGRKPMLSKPFQALVIESKTVEAELIFKARPPRDLPQRLVLQNFMRYEGPFEKDQIDLNGGRRWDPVDPITADLRPPPGGPEPPAALLRLIKEVKEAVPMPDAKGLKKKGPPGPAKPKASPP